jgi:hypothetical protein
MGWAIGYDNRWKRDIGYGVPAECDHPKCKVQIDRGLAHVCAGEQPYGGENGCGLYFCSEHMHYHHFRGTDYAVECCKRCSSHASPYKPKPDVKEWIEHKLRDESWGPWRKSHPEEVKAMRTRLSTL